ncbi:MAG: response regulator [Limisphaerales bacterium]
MSPTKVILVVDDNANDLQLTTMALARLKLPQSVVVARDGADALDYLYCRGEFQTRPAGNPDLVLLDIKMPRVDGLETLRKIKADARFNMIPVVMFTSSRESDDIRNSYAWGANAYVVKPVEFDALLGAVRDLGTFWTTINEPPPDNHLPAKPDLCRGVVVA